MHRIRRKGQVIVPFAKTEKASWLDRVE